VLTNRAAVVAVDERTGTVIHELGFPSGRYTIAYGSGALFVADFRSGQLFRIDANYAVHRLQPVRGPGTLIAVTTRGDLGDHRIGDAEAHRCSQG
jgi:hypothetical protein